MERVCFCLQVRKDRLEEYREKHAKVWPEMLQAISDAGWRNYSLFLRDDGLLIGYFEATDFQMALRALTSQEINTRWQQEMGPFFVKTGDAGADQSLPRLQEVFHTN